MRGHRKKHAMVIAAMAATCVSTTATAGIPVFDVMNFASNVAQNFQLTMIKHTLTDKGNGTINHYTNNIDNSTKSIDVTATKIHNVNTEIFNKTVYNTAITADFTWIINKGSDEIIPIPYEVEKMLAKVRGEGDSDAYAARFKEASTYYASLGGKQGDTTAAGFEGSRARKAANDALVKVLDIEEGRLAGEAEGLEDLADKSNKAEGHGRQLQIANALAGSQANQLIKLRSIMLASETARAAEAQAVADKEARAIATSRRLRDGLDDAIVTARKPLPSF